MKTGLFILLLILPALALAADDRIPHQERDTGAQTLGTARETDEDLSTNWVDDSHAYATDRAQALTEWMDSFFGDPVYDLEKPESLLRLEWANTWDEIDDYKSRVRLRGKVRLPRLSERVNIIFFGEDGDTAADEDDRLDDKAAEILYNVGERSRSRMDLTLRMNSSGLIPGVRFRNQGPITDLWRYRYTQRAEWEDDEGFYTTGQFNLDHALSDTELARWSSRLLYGEESYGLEWKTALSYRRKLETPTLHDPFVVSYFASVTGNTDPSWIENYKLGLLFRRQIFRRYFFMEVEPSYNFRKREYNVSRDGAWNIVLRLEILFETARRRTPEVVQAEREAARLHTSAQPPARD